MTRFEKLQEAAAELSDEHVDALIALARSMNGKPFYDVAPIEALQSIDLGMAQIDRGETIALDEYRRLRDPAAQPNKK